MHMKNKRNSGIATMEIIIAAVIVAVVVIGVVIAIKMVSGGSGESSDTTQSSDDKIAESVYAKIKSYVDAADLSVSFTGSLNTMRIVSREGYQVIYYETSSGKLYLNDHEGYSNPDISDSNRIAVAARANCDSSNELMAQNITSFYIDGTDDLTVSGLSIELQIKVNDTYKTYKIPVNTEMTAYQQDPEGYVPKTTPAADDSAETAAATEAAETTPDPTSTPVPTNTPTPTPEPAETEEADANAGTNTVVLLDGDNGQISVADLSAGGENAILRVTVVRAEYEGHEDVAEGWVIGGLCFGSWTVDSNYGKPATADQIVNEGETFTIEWSAKELCDYAQALGADTINVNYYCGYKCQLAELIY